MRPGYAPAHHRHRMVVSGPRRVTRRARTRRVYIRRDGQRVAAQRVPLHRYRVRRSSQLPRSRRFGWLRHRGRRYGYHDGYYWVRHGSSWVTVRPPLGLVVSWLPPRRVAFWVDEQPYYECDGITYVPIAGGGYQVVSRPRYY